MYNQDIFLYSSAFLTVGDIKNFFKASLNANLCLEITKLNVVVNLPQFSSSEFMQIQSFEELFRKCPGLYYVLFNPSYLNSHINNNELIDNTLKETLTVEIKNVYRKKRIKDLKYYWDNYFGKMICYRTFNLTNEIIWGIYDSMNSTKIVLGDLLFTSRKGVIKIFYSDVVVYKIDIKNRLISFLAHFKYKDEIEFYLRNPYYLKCIGKVKYI